MKAYAVIEARLPESGDKIAARSIVYLKLPDMARIEVMGAFNGLAAVIVSSGKDCSYSLNGAVKPCGGKGNALTHPSDGYPGAALASSVPFLMGSTTNSADEVGDENGITVLEYKGDSLVIELSDYRDVRGISIPFSIKAIKQSESDNEIHIKYSSVELNPEEMSGDTADFFSLPPR